MMVVAGPVQSANSMDCPPRIHSLYQTSQQARSVIRLSSAFFFRDRVHMARAVVHLRSSRLPAPFMVGAPRSVLERREVRRQALYTPDSPPPLSIASTVAEDIEMEDILLQTVESETLESVINFKARLTHWFRQMMFVSGETAEPSAETTWMIEEIVREQVIEMVWMLPHIQSPLTTSASTSDSPCQPTRLQIHLHRRPDLSNPTQHRQSLPSEDVPLLEGRAQECQRLR